MTDPAAIPFPLAPQALNCRGRLLSLDRPRILGILNVTPDSFSDGGRYQQPDAALAHAERLLAEGADIVDIGGYSSRPGAEDIPLQAELDRVLPVVRRIRRELPEALLSIDTFRAPVAAAALAEGVHLVNDISGGLLDADMHRTVAAAGAPYILMHMQGTPQTMQQNPQYDDVVLAVYDHFVAQIRQAAAAGIHDIVLDPGFGFGKTFAHNRSIFSQLHVFRSLGRPLLVGLSRKRMLAAVTGSDTHDTGFALAAAHWQALSAGVQLLRVHEPAQARQVLDLRNFITHGTVPGRLP